MRFLLPVCLALAACAEGQRAIPLGDAGARDLAGFLEQDDLGSGPDQSTPNDLAGADLTGFTPPDLSGADLSGGSCDLKVNEVQTGGSTATDEFIEIYNPCSGSILLTGYKLIYRAATATTDSGTIATLSGSLGSHGYYLVANSGYAGTADIKPYNGSITGLAATGGAVGIRDSGGNLVDSVGWGSANNIFVETAVVTAPAASRSIARHPDGTDTNNNSTDFTDSTPTPKASN